ncbi:MAG TPA: hypothetical protein VH702_08230 [Vicinamibacterales bacterium]|jgi:hypothetical protein
MGCILKTFSATALAMAFLVPAVGSNTVAARANDKVKITGCVIRTNDQGSGGNRSLVVWSGGDVVFANAVVEFEPSSDSKEIGKVVATSGGGLPIFYWLDDDDDLEKHVGQSVELTGELDDDFERGEMKFGRKGEFTEIEFEVNGKDVKARVPTSMLINAEGKDSNKDRKYNVVVRRVDVDNVKMLSASCSR